MRRSTIVSIAAAFLLAVVSASPAPAKTVWKINTLLTPESSLGQGVETFVKKVEELSNGEMEIQMFYRGQLGKNIPVVMQSLMAGDLHGFIESGNYFGSLDKRFNVLDAPYAFKSRQQFINFLRSPTFQDMANTIYGKGIKIVNSEKMNWFRTEDRSVLMRHPVITPEDLGKQKIRQYQAEMPIQGLLALGANVQVIPWPDVYTAIMTGTVDGLETVLSQSVQNKHVEGAKFHTILQLYFQQAYIMVSRKAWEALSPALKEVVSKASTAGGDTYREASIIESAEYEAVAARDYGVTIIKPPLKPFQDLIKTAHKKWIAKGLLPKETMEFIATLKY